MCFLAFLPSVYVSLSFCHVFGDQYLIMDVLLITLIIVNDECCRRYVRIPAVGEKWWTTDHRGTMAGDSKCALGESAGRTDHNGRCGCVTGSHCTG